MRAYSDARPVGARVAGWGRANRRRRVAPVRAPWGTRRRDRDLETPRACKLRGGRWRWGAAPPAPGGRGADVRPELRPVGGGRRPAAAPAAHGLRGGRAEAPGRGAQLRRQGARAVALPKLRGAAAREPKASARGAARGKRAAPMQFASTTRRSATNGSGAPDAPLVALADSLLGTRQEMRAPVKGACNAGAERRLAAGPGAAGRGAGEPRRRLLEAANAAGSCRQSCAAAAARPEAKPMARAAWRNVRGEPEPRRGALEAANAAGSDPRVAPRRPRAGGEAEARADWRNGQGDLTPVQARKRAPIDAARGEVGSSARDAAVLERTGDAGAAWRDRCRAHGRIPFRARLQRA